MTERSDQLQARKQSGMNEPDRKGDRRKHQDRRYIIYIYSNCKKVTCSARSRGTDKAGQ